MSKPCKCITRILPGGFISVHIPAGPVVPVSNVSLASESSPLVAVINYASNYLLPSNPVLYSKASDDLALNVSPNLRQKIIAGEYVDLANLLINSQAAVRRSKIGFCKGRNCCLKKIPK